MTEVRLGDIVELQRGNKYQGALLGQPGPVLLGLASIARNGGFRSDNLKTYGGTSDPRMLLSPGDLYVSLKDVTQSADLLGAVARVPPFIKLGRLTQDTVKLSFKTSSIPPDYIYWLLRTPQYREYCRAHSTGTTNLGLPREDFLSFPIPELTHDNRAIFSLLSALDAKIELNRRMNETLEAMAQAIFRDWFVDFGPTRRKLALFAGATTASRKRAGITDPVQIMGGLIQSPARAAKLAALFPDAMGDNGLPEGWEECAAEDLIDFNPSEALRKGTVSPYADMSSLPTTGSTAEAPIQREFGSGMKFKNGDALIARITPCLENGKAAFVDFLPNSTTVGWGSTEFIVLRSRPPVPPPFAYLLVRHPEFKTRAVQSMTGTSGRQRAQAETLKAFQLTRATAKLFAEFGRLAVPMFAKITGNASESQTLAATRDLLLPKLMSGEIRLSDAEAMAEAAQ